MTVNGDVSFWYRETGLPSLRPALDGDRQADVAIVGAGYTGLWTAYALTKADPSLEIVLLERRFAGYGASGRNGGWLTNSITGGRESYLASHGRTTVGRFQELMNEAVDEVAHVCAEEGIDADLVKGGELTVARTPAARARLEAFAASEAEFPEAGTRLLSAGETDERLRIRGTLAGLHHPHAARIQPAKLVQGLARVVEALGVTIHEGTTVTAIEPGVPGGRDPRAVTERGTVTARHVIRATEGFTATMSQSHREWLPLNSSMIATEPLPAAVWDDLGWQHRDVVGDMAHVYMYAQRTADDRIALGGRGVPYRYGSRVDTDGTTRASTIAELTGILADMFPAAAGAAIDHAWSGVLGVPRDWRATVGLDASSGVGWAGGYVGTGVTTTNLAGRTLADLVRRARGEGGDTELLRMPWVGHRAHQWEPEPLRWLGVNLIYGSYRLADRQESQGASSRTSPFAALADRISGH
ncbi:NAD(P)/FAD-dependent oxidoreductase [Frondihabitans australicus]|uniref:Glycine/D-amino acid oxidase-like deaminating enzyme n=1 Tax=Frondihabitans australicus TaxID=386892 RepID=A0A495II03_9MICO|nr:FAD-dependent oxidoreductase [Frondihabitans australicus]RKR75604.1 glycine/D-amino acid oxidase-like deaminating enzyme [Frondihabitans australicus]